MKNKSVIIILILLVLSIGVNIYLSLNNSDSNSTSNIEESESLYTCGMHPDILDPEQGNCPICGMKLTPVKSNTNANGEKEILYWRAPMDPNEIYNEPGKSKMGMDLVPVYSGDPASAGIVNIDGTVQQTMNLKLTDVKIMDFKKSIRTNAIVSTDERNEFRINSKYSGWLEKMYVNFIGQEVKKGQKLFDIYSPELLSAQNELLTSINYAKSIGEEPLENKMVNMSVEKLRLLDLPESLINEIIKSGKISRTLPFFSPENGTVIMKQKVEGEKISPGQTILHIANLNSLWIIADIYESDLPHIKVGDNAEVSFSYFPTEIINAKVSFIYPSVDEKTRTAKIRLDINNKNKKIKPGMYANVSLSGMELNNVLAVDASAVIRSGKNNIVVLALGEGKFKPVQVTTGNYIDGYIEILSGLTEGNKIVSSAQFLIDSEASLKSAIGQFEKSTSSEPTNTAALTDSPIDVEKADQNGDGKLYQCPMDWHILHDEKGRCEICEMHLKEYSIEEVKKNLTEHNLEYVQDGKNEEPHSHDNTQEKNTDVEHHSPEIIKSKDESHVHSNEIKEDKTEPENEYGIDHEWIRTGIINVESLDKNADGKLWECPMDWNIIHDEYARCPVCEMKMKEYSLSEIKTNLKKFGYKHK